ncbi:Na+/H+ antiporter NhaD type (plasmid) [Sulfuricella denitrificans skB26]|uniref:Na+/H+ antiporter NhaD type n=1 Tax=Sulfuricella denitrificans (strain DSM 22764 / NBRC 105220 / skB26) TaxID=1163617 RepID=S6ABN9_SULDS|nr:Na+/H+ antiporter NhaD type [Sulfuricella denitrificans skB26]
MKRFALLFTLLFMPLLAHASEGAARLDLTGSWVGIVSVLLFFVAYLVVMAEEYTHLRKSKPVMLAAGIIWALIAWHYQSQDIPHLVENALRHTLEEYAELMLFLLVAMTFINAMDERNVFEALRSWLIRKGLGYRALFWVTGLLAFFISPIADNLTTALLMGAVVMAVGGGNKKFIMLSCINIVIAANAGGAFSPFGDITTLMVWQKNIQATNGMVDFWVFFALFIPSLVNWLVPAAIMHFAVPNEKPKGSGVIVAMRRGALTIVALFLFTIMLAVSFHSVLKLPPVIGMLTGLSLLQFFAYYLKVRGEKTHSRNGDAENIGNPVPFDIFRKVSRAEWDTLFFFYGVVMCVGGLSFIGYLGMISQVIYGGWGASNANIAVGIISAIVDNIPVMFAVLAMMPDMSVGQWLLVTLTAGVGGSLLSIGSAAGVALMGQARGVYTFFGHLKWTPAIALGYAASIGVHIAINRSLF